VLAVDFRMSESREGHEVDARGIQNQFHAHQNSNRVTAADHREQTAGKEHAGQHEIIGQRIGAIDQKLRQFSKEAWHVS